MKVGIMTFHASNNCGSMLQAFALQQTLIRKYGAEAEIINYSNKAQRGMYGLIDTRIKKSALRNNRMNFPYLRVIEKMRRDYQAFSKAHLIVSGRLLKNRSQLPQAAAKYDLLIAGGDQVWNIVCGDHDDAYFLNFAKDIRKVAYSPSLGAQNILEKAKDPNVYREYLKDFEAISVRERNGQKWLRELTGREVPIIADPTLLLTKEEWEQWLPLEDVPGDYIFNYAYYHHDPATNRAIGEIGRKLNMPVYTIDYRSSCIYKLSEYGIERYKASGPLAMLSLMKNARLVLTQSFHGTVFAAMFERPFYSYHAPVIKSPNDDRATYLLEQLGLSERYVVINDLAEEQDIIKPYDTEAVRARYAKMRENAFLYLDSFMK